MIDECVFVSDIESNKNILFRVLLAISSSCASVNFTCRNGQCLSRRKVCDGQSDCSDSSDEDTRFCCKKMHLLKDTL
jgi:hypothetical protein